MSKQQTPLRHPVGDQPAPGAEEEHRQELERGGQADGDAAAGQGEDHPDLRHRLHPVAGERDQLAGEVAAVVGDPEAGEGAAEGFGHRRSPLRARGSAAGSCSSIRSSTSAARSSAARSSGGRSRNRCRQVGGLPRPAAFAAAPGPRWLTLRIEQRPSSGSRTRSTRPARSRWPRIRVAVGRLIRSRSASSLGASGPWRSIVARAAVCEGPRSLPASWRSRRAVRDDREPQARRQLLFEAYGGCGGAWQSSYPR